MSSHYTDDSDSPGWVTNAQGGLTATTVYADLVAEDLSLSLISGWAGSRGELALTTPRGDVAATITLATPSATAAGLDSWTRYTEYGAPVTAQPVGQVGAAGNVSLWFLSSRCGRFCLVVGAVAEHGVEDVAAAAGEADEGGVVLLASGSFPVVVGP